MANSPPTTFSESLELKELGNNAFETVHPPQKMGNPLNIAYGGYALATACKAACLTVGKEHHLYSLLGNYLGPAFTDRPLHADVQVIRQTRTFATRQIQVSQKQDNGTLRLCLIAIADFHVKEAITVLEYSRRPSKAYTPYNDLPSQQEVSQQLVAEGKISKQLCDEHAKTFSVMSHIFTSRPCPEGIFAQNLGGVAKSLVHSQDSLPLPSRTTADWFRSHETLSTPIQHVAALAFFSDGAISFAPLSFSHLWFEDVAAVSSLDFALRLFTTEVNVEDWCLREIETRVGSEGRTYSESWIWDREGRAVACMSQQSILRGRGKKEPVEKGKL